MNAAMLLLLVSSSALLQWSCAAAAPWTLPLPNVNNTNTYLGDLIPNTIAVADETDLGLLSVSALTLSGMSHFDTVYTKFNFAEKKVSIQIKYRHLYVNGLYSIQYFISKTDKQPIKANVKNVNVQMTAMLGSDADGNIKVADMNMDVEFDECDMDLDGAAVMSWLFSNACPSIFQSVKSFVMENVVKIAKDETNRRLKAAISRNRSPGDETNNNPSELVAGLLRSQMQRMDIDPLRVPVNKTFNLGFPTITVNTFAVSGLSDVRRVDNVVAQLVGAELRASFLLSAGPLNGTVDGRVTWWPLVGAAQPFKADYAVDRAWLRIAVVQSLGSATARPALDGHMSLRMDGLRLLEAPTLLGLATRALTTAFEGYVVEEFRGPLELAVQSMLDRTRLDAIVSEMMTTV